ncbi:nucleotidyltransferase [Kordiimonas sp. SCSIO 12603]|uniref:nucleotidyltransferase n=1 Tax=Kordiimonas sp. SCSIO 12603 TaxID=2829596 RepID=UPI0021043980|nr:nucleotidyltransferase [Kordiimonas sp. SCSIO 12603]UTW59655.1 nucleotidyltransferase [Kordiimonas sp. SCSIO 12603]
METVLLNFDQEALDAVLYEIADKIQLSATKYDLAKDRYKAIADHLNEKESEVARFSPHIYPQGSFRIQTAVSNSDEKDEFDIDLILEMNIDTDNDPDVVLDSVCRSLDRGRYKGKVEKKRRCVQVQYSDMHLDVTPAVLLSKGLPSRPSQIFDCHPNRANHVEAAPEGFALWFDEQVLPSQLLESRRLVAKASVDPVPDQKQLEEKPPKLVALQLIKRWRDMQDSRRKGDDEKIPSILLSKLAADYLEGGDQSLYSVLTHMTSHLIRLMSQDLGAVLNPSYERDVFTDRWPGARTTSDALPSNQEIFLEDLKVLKANLDEMAGASPNRHRELMKTMFGERSSASGSALYEGSNFAQQQGLATDKDLVERIIAGGKAFLTSLSLGTSYEKQPKWPMIPSCFVQVTASIHAEKRGQLLRQIENGGAVGIGKHICFRAIGRSMRPDGSTFPRGSVIHWRVTNTGKVAAREKQLRGDFNDDTGISLWEHAAYEGIHWVQAYVVDMRGNCIGQSERFCIVVS